ncbi:MAG: ribonuclease III [Acidobacteria bacterium]|nr:ribonuclease III [Acidobacteriota bacterium]
MSARHPVRSRCPPRCRRQRRVVSEHPDRDLTDLEARLGYAFSDRLLLERALTHRSYSHEVDLRETGDNELLEFLGDAVIGLVMSHVIHARWGGAGSPGDASQCKAMLVSRGTLSAMGSRLALSDFLRLGRGEERSGGRTKASLIANAFEAVTGAVFLDGGYKAARRVLDRVYADLYDELLPRSPSAPLASVDGAGYRDPKSALQEWLQARGRSLPVYTVLDTSGPDHHKTFQVAVAIDGAPACTATGDSKKGAEQAAAREILRRLRAATEDGLSGLAPEPDSPQSISIRSTGGSGSKGVAPDSPDEGRS